MRRGLIAALALAAGAVVLASPRVSQDPAYHEMADQRVLLGIPNSLNVLSNAPFAIVGLLGLVATFRRPESLFDDPWIRRPYAAVFGGAVLTALGSSFYHLEPGNWRLVWDRLPITLTLMALLTAVIAERVSLTTSRRLFVPLLMLGAVSVAYWYWSELRGAGDLRLYGLVQFGSLLVIVLLLLLNPGRHGGTRHLAAGLVAYAASKGLELADQRIFELGHVVSGHTLKHIAAAAGLGCVLMMLYARRTPPGSFSKRD